METAEGWLVLQPAWMIEVEDVAKAFGEVEALSGVSFTAAGGEVVGLLGPNGAGKTTLVRIIATLLRPDRGTVRVGGVDVARDPQGVRRRIGLAGQAAAVDGMLSGRENLELVGALYGLDRERCRSRATETLKRFDLADAADRRAATYSGGMRRRLDLAATMIGAPAVVLLDEPTAGLDPRSRNELWEFVREVAASGTTVLLTTQNLDEADRLADRIVVIDRGSVIADAPPAGLKAALHADVVEASVGGDGDLAATSAILADVGGVAPVVDDADGRVSVVTNTGVATLVAAARALDDAGVELLDLGVRRPSLDDVFLELTGDGDRREPITVARTVDPPATVLPVVEMPRRHAVRDATVVTGRYLRRFARTPQMYIWSAAQPISFVLALNVVFGGLVSAVTGGNYIQFLLPGVVVMNVLLGASITSAGVAQDLQDGIVDRFRSLPMSRVAVLAGRTFADLSRNVVSLAFVIAAGVVVGFRFHGSAGDALVAVALTLAFSYAISWLFACIGMAVKDPTVAQLAGFLPALPLVYLSGSWVPVETMSGAVQTFARNQPVNVFVEAVRSLAAGVPPGDRLWQAALWAVAMLAVAVPLSVKLYRGDGA
jgi:ABC-2 type transport system ATP-binding protein